MKNNQGSFYPPYAHKENPPLESDEKEAIHPEKKDKIHKRILKTMVKKVSKIVSSFSKLIRISTRSKSKKRSHSKSHQKNPEPESGYELIGDKPHSALIEEESFSVQTDYIASGSKYSYNEDSLTHIFIK